jgi:trans-aconitate methyltransferase
VSRWQLDVDRPDPARRYNALLGGKDNFAADRTSAQRLATVLPSIYAAARENRRWLNRAVTYLAGDAGLRQFLDIGCGLPAAPNVHDLAQRVAPDARTVYVDNDPLVMTHARALLTGPAGSGTACVEADLRTPHTILTEPAVRATLDFTAPIGLLLAAVLHFLDDTANPYSAVAELVAALAPGSYLAISHVTFDPLPTDQAERLTALCDPAAGHGTFRARTRHEIEAFLDGLHLLEPGLVSIVDWQPELDPRPRISAREAATYAAVARLP